MVAIVPKAPGRSTASAAAVTELEALVPAAMKLTELLIENEINEMEFEAGLANLFRRARRAQAALETDFYRVHLDWTKDPIRVERVGDPDRFADLHARLDQSMQPYLGYGWEYSGGSARDALHFDEQDVDGEVMIKGAWVDLVRGGTD